MTQNIQSSTSLAISCFFLYMTIHICISFDCFSVLTCRTSCSLSRPVTQDSVAVCLARREWEKECGSWLYFFLEYSYVVALHLPLVCTFCFVLTSVKSL